MGRTGSGRRFRRTNLFGDHRDEAREAPLERGVIQWNRGQVEVVPHRLAGPEIVCVAAIQLTTERATYPVWSPDGNRIAYVEGGRPPDNVMRADGSEKTHVGTGSSPQWSPDGTRLAFCEGTSRSSTKGVEHVVRLDTGDSELVFENRPHLSATRLHGGRNEAMWDVSQVSGADRRRLRSPFCVVWGRFDHWPQCANSGALRRDDLRRLRRARNSDGQATAASFHGPHGLDFDQAGNLYVADEGNHLIRKISPGGQVTTPGRIR